MRGIAGARAAEAAPPAFSVLDVYEGFASLRRRSPTLDGSVPVRVAQACVPLLEGNAFGFQVTLRDTLRLQRRLGFLQIADDGGVRARLHDAALPRLVAHGLLAEGSPWHRELARGPAVLVTRAGRPCLRLFTGLLVRPADGVWLRITAAANRRNTSIEVEESVIPDGQPFIPLVLTILLPRSATEHLRLEGEVACVAPLRPGVRVAALPLSELPDIGRAHVAFYDQAYFDEKRSGGVTVKYRRLVGREAPPVPAPRDAACEVAVAGPAPLEVVGTPLFTTAASPEPVARPGEARRLESVVFHNPIAFDAHYDGNTVALTYSAEDLARAARAVEQAWDLAYGAGFRDAHRGALLYLTKLFTPHPPGEPHFFVKPWALLRTPPGWSCLLDGVHGEGYDVMRGVVATDVFHAIPAVFHVRREGQALRVPAGQPLMRAIPVPRDLLAAGMDVARLPDTP